MANIAELPSDFNDSFYDLCYPKSPSQTPQPSRAIPSPSFWLRNGDIIVSAPLEVPCDECQRQLFRLHTCMLISTGSSVFAAMIHSTLGVECVETHEGVPIMVMDDYAETMLVLFQLIYQFPSVCSARSLENAMGICSKYDLTSTLSRTLPPMIARWPQTLAGWDHNLGQISSRSVLNIPSGHTTIFMQDTAVPTDAVTIASLLSIAHQHNIQQTRPALFYFLSRIPESQWSASRENWSLAELSTLKRIRRFLDHVLLVLQSKGIPSSSRKQAHSRCLTVCCAVKRVMCMRISDEARRNRDILITLRRHLDGEYLSTHGACVDCTLSSIRVLQHVRKEIWKTIVTIVGTPASVLVEIPPILRLSNVV